MRPDLSPLRLIAPAVRSRAASLTGAAVLLVAYSAVAVSPALVTQQLIDRSLAAGNVPLVAALACALVAVAAVGSALSVLAARALLRGADVLLLDEPATGLDPAAKASLRDLLARLARERLVVAVDHEGLFDDVADQVIEL